MKLPTWLGGDLGRFALRGLTIATVAASAAYVAINASNQWDFHAYYGAASALRAGLNPYDAAAVSVHTGRPAELPYLYPPATLALFAPLSRLPVETARLVWLGIKTSLLILLLWLWRRFFVPAGSKELLVATALLGFNAAVLWDLRAGNVAMLEAVLLWGGFGAYLQGHRTVAAALVTLGGSFKVLPMALLSVVLVGPGSTRSRLAAGAAALGVLGLLSAVHADLLHAWAQVVGQSLTGERPVGEINPSSLGFIDSTLSGALPSASHPWAAVALYAAFVLAVLGLSTPTLLRLAHVEPRRDWVLFCVLLWLLLSPRVMVYSYVMAIVPSLVVLSNRIATVSWRAFAWGFVVLQGCLRFLPGPPPTFLGPMSFLITLVFWIVLVRAGSHEVGQAA